MRETAARGARRVRGFVRLAALTTIFAAASAHAAEGGLRDFCAHRPGKATPPCLIDPGHLMVEVDALDLAHTRAAGVTQDATLLLSPQFRYGLGDRFEVAVTFAPSQRLRTRDPSGAVSTVSGTGDSQLALTYSLRNPDGSGTSAALEGFVGLPTAEHGLGAGGFQGGVVLPLALPLPAGFALGLSPEVDALRSPGRGLHPAYVAAAALSHGLGHAVTGSLELWASRNEDPAGHVTQATFDADLAWIPHARPNLQLDGGVNLGLDRAAPGVEAYLGVARRF
ncbi:MAG: transporter [Alphaproteobacteria bacterium]|nr:transporter [Alphaproteobacteria bacterium]